MNDEMLKHLLREADRPAKPSLVTSQALAAGAFAVVLRKRARRRVLTAASSLAFLLVASIVVLHWHDRSPDGQRSRPVVAEGLTIAERLAREEMAARMIAANQILAHQNPGDDVVETIRSYVARVHPDTLTISRTTVSSQKGAMQ